MVACSHGTALSRAYPPTSPIAENTARAAIIPRLRRRRVIATATDMVTDTVTVTATGTRVGGVGGRDTTLVGARLLRTSTNRVNCENGPPNMGIRGWGGGLLAEKGVWVELGLLILR